jgi:hypothetical protein
MEATEQWRAAALAGLTALLAACGGPADEWPVPGLPGDTLTLTRDTAGEETALPDVAIADIQADRRAMTAVDSRFPHSEHRTVECQRCHQRPPGHATHQDQECRACHGRPAGFDNLPERTARECAACHHQDAQQLRCRACHQADQVGARPVLVAVQATGATEARVRRLTFDHDDHQSRECLTCHTTSVTLQFGLECASCHEYHHRQDARCMTCHEQFETPAHSAQVHVGCAGGGCHGDAPVLSLAPTRNVCQVCHQDMVQHRPGRECTACHVGFGDSLRERAPGGGP